MAPKAKKKRAKTGGRKKGTPNKMTVGVKAALGEVFTWIGGVPAMAAWAKDNPTEFYRLWAKTLPHEVKAELSGPGGKPIQHESAHTVTVTAEDVALARAVLGVAGGDVHPHGGPQPVVAAPNPAPQAAGVPPARR